jgi:hypothetical protein
MHIVLEDLRLKKLYLVYPVGERYLLDERVEILSLAIFPVC